MARASLFIAGLCLLAAACARAQPPRELAGLWSAGQAPCTAGAGIRFDSDAIRMVYETDSETVFESPRYQVLSGGESFRVRITYSMPHIAGGAREPGARGVLVLARGAHGILAPVTHNLIYGRTGAARARLGEDPATRLLTLEPCGDHPWRRGLRGLSHS